MEESQTQDAPTTPSGNGDQTNAPVEAPTAAAENKNSGLMKILIPVIAVLVLGGAVFGAYHKFSKKEVPADRFSPE